MPYKDRHEQRKAELRYRARNLEEIRKRAAKAAYLSRKKMKDAVYEKLGNKCSNPDCNWVNESGKRGCTDRRCLQVDHIRGNGSEDRSRGIVGHSLYKRVLEDTENTYQLLCANCNWIKRSTNREFSKLWYRSLELVS